MILLKVMWLQSGLSAAALASLTAVFPPSLPLFPPGLLPPDQMLPHPPSPRMTLSSLLHLPAYLLPRPWFLPPKLRLPSWRPFRLSIACQVRAAPRQHPSQLQSCPAVTQATRTQLLLVKCMARQGFSQRGSSQSPRKQGSCQHLQSPESARKQFTSQRQLCPP